MRPRKVILLLDDQDRRRRIRRFVFEVRGPWRVLSGRTLPRNPGPRLEDALCRAEVAVIDSATATVTMCAELKRLLPRIKIVAIGADGAGHADLWMARARVHECSMADMLETVRVLAARRRGPKKGAGSVRFMKGMQRAA